MSKEYRISIVGEQRLDGEDDKIEVITEGRFMKKRDRFFIGYKEYDADNPGEHFDNLIKVEPQMVTIIRKGPMASQLMLEKGRRHQCLYQTGMGDLMIGVFTTNLENNLNEEGGTLEVSYTLDFNTDLVSENRFFITVEKK